MDLSNWYYTYSTISQTLAALYGFLLAAYTFRVTSSDAAQTARLAAYEEAARQNPPDYTTLARTAFRQGVDVDQIQGLARSMRISFKWTIGTIAACLVLMPLTVQGLIFGKPIIAWPCLVLVVASALKCLATYYPVMMVVISRPE